MDKKKTYVLDTSALIDDPDIFYKLGPNGIVVPTAVIKEIDGLKRNPDPEEPRAKAARRVARLLDRLGSSQDIAVGARTSSGSMVRIFNRYATIDDLASNADNRVVGSAIKLKEETQAAVILISTDSNMRTVARSYGIKTENYPCYLGDSFDRSKGSLPPQKNSVVDLRSYCLQKRKTKGVNRTLNSKQNVVFWIALAFLIALLVMAR